MLGTRPKLVLVAGTLLWAGFMVYLLAHVERFASYGGSLGIGARWAGQLLSGDSNITESDDANSLLSMISEDQDAEAPINIVMQANENDLGGLIAAVNSVISNSKQKIHFYFVVPESSTEHLNKWMKVSQLSKVKYSVAKLPDDLAKYNRASKVAFVDLFPALQGQVIYLDSDVIVQGDVKDLHATPLVPGSLAAFSDDCHAGSASKSVLSHGENRFATRLNLKHPDIAALEINPVTCTFSTGVFLTSDIEVWRKEELLTRVLNLLQANEKETILGPQGGADQFEAAMLAVFYGRASPLEPLWHVRNLGLTRGTRYSTMFLSNARLLHWSGHFKPWKPSRGSLTGIGATYEQKIWEKYFIRDPTGQFTPIRSKNTREI